MGKSWESSVSWDGSDGNREGRRLRRRSVRVGDIGELKHGRMVGEDDPTYARLTDVCQTTDRCIPSISHLGEKTSEIKIILAARMEF